MAPKNTQKAKAKSKIVLPGDKNFNTKTGKSPSVNRPPDPETRGKKTGTLIRPFDVDPSDLQEIQELDRNQVGDLSDKQIDHSAIEGTLVKNPSSFFEGDAPDELPEHVSFAGIDPEDPKLQSRGRVGSFQTQPSRSIIRSTNPQRNIQISQPNQAPPRKAKALTEQDFDEAEQALAFLSGTEAPPKKVGAKIIIPGNPEPQSQEPETDPDQEDDMADQPSIPVIPQIITPTPQTQTAQVIQQVEVAIKINAEHPAIKERISYALKRNMAEGTRASIILTQTIANLQVQESQNSPLISIPVVLPDILRELTESKPAPAQDTTTLATKEQEIILLSSSIKEEKRKVEELHALNTALQLNNKLMTDKIRELESKLSSASKDLESYQSCLKEEQARATQFESILNTSTDPVILPASNPAISQFFTNQTMGLLKWARVAIFICDTEIELLKDPKDKESSLKKRVPTDAFIKALISQ